MNEHRPSKELVDRLRNSASIEHPCSPGLARKAADEIERLQRHIAEQDQQMHQMGVCQTCAERDRATGEPPASPLREVVQAVVDWNTKYPSSRIYGETSIRRIAAEMDVIFEKAKAALTASEPPASDRGATHASDCWGWGPRHYDCALTELKHAHEVIAHQGLQLWHGASQPPPPDVHRRVAELYDAALCSITFNLSEPVSAKEAQRALDAAKEIK